MGLKLGSGIRGQSTEQAWQAQEVDAITTPLVEIIFPDSDNLSAYNAVFRHCPPNGCTLGLAVGTLRHLYRHQDIGRFSNRTPRCENLRILSSDDCRHLELTEPQDDIGADSAVIASYPLPES